MPVVVRLSAPITTPSSYCGCKGDKDREDKEEEEKEEKEEEVEQEDEVVK